jgi:cytochrome c
LESDAVYSYFVFLPIILEIKMIVKALHRSLMGAVASAALAMSLPAVAQVDEDAAKLLFKQNECTKCHNPEKDKKGPSLKKIAKEYKAKADAEQQIAKHLTTAKQVKLDDGTEQEHKVLDTKDPKAVSNLAKWILSN